MLAPVFIGDEVSAAGYRLAGADIRTPAKDELVREFRRALGETDFLILTAAHAALLPPTLIAEAVRRAEPLVLIVPDVVERLDPPDYGVAAARALGIAP